MSDAQYELVRGTAESGEEAVDQYDFVLVTERYFESLVVLRHVLGVALAEVLFLMAEDPSEHVVPLSAQPQRFLDVLTDRNPNDRALFDAANVCPTLLIF